jgi:hypothetical protein
VTYDDPEWNEGEEERYSVPGYKIVEKKHPVLTIQLNQEHLGEVTGYIPPVLLHADPKANL